MINFAVISLANFLNISSFFDPHLSTQNLPFQIHAISYQHELTGGSVAVFCNDKLGNLIPFGLANIDRKIPVTENSAFRVASISKVITAIAILQLYDQKLFDIDADIEESLGYKVRNPNYPDQKITGRMLLSHTSTIIDGDKYGSFLEATYNAASMPAMKDLVMPEGPYYSTNLFKNHRPGSFFQYSSLNYGLLGTIIEKISGLRFDEYCRQKILLPLGIKGSFNIADFSDLDTIAVLYRKPKGTWVAQADNYQGQWPTNENLQNYVPGKNGLRFAPQGGLRISAKDLSKVFMALLNQGSYQGKRILSAASVNEMLRSQWIYDGQNGEVYNGLFRGWGLGVHRPTNTPNIDIVLKRSKQMMGHFGEAYGLVSDAYIDLERKLGFILIINGSGKGYTNSSNSAFYTVKTAVFAAIESYGDLGACSVRR